MTALKKLVFHNPETRPLNIAIDTSAESAALVIEWYGGYYSGDNYTVSFDGRNIAIDQNGWPTELGLAEIERANL
jgi:hypothetical protein